MANTTTHTLRIIRVGANHNCYLVPRNTLTIDYESGEIIAQT